MLTVLIGPSCSGKTTLQQKMVQNDGYHAVRTATTRPRRYGRRLFYLLLPQGWCPLESGNDEEILSVVRSSEAGNTEFRVMRFPDGTTGLIELSYSQSEERSNSSVDTLISWLETD
nr:MAG TPA: AAA domain protein [Caudoviricetes sp.]